MDPARVEPNFVDQLARPDDWFAHPALVLIKDTQKTRVGKIATRIGSEQRTIYVKRYNAFSWRYRIGSLFTRSAARRALDGAEVLAGARIACASPVASIEIRRLGMLESSFFVSEEIAGAQTSDRFWRNALQPVRGRAGFYLRRDYLERLAKLFAELHAQRIYHDDLKDANIMAFAGEAGPQFALLDLEGVRRCSRLTRRRRIKNLVQLYRTHGKYLNRSHKLYFLKKYLGADFAHRPLSRSVAETIILIARRVDGRKARESSARQARIQR